METIKKLIIEQAQEDFKEWEEKVKTEDGLKLALNHYHNGKPYIKDNEKKILKLIYKKTDKRVQQQLKKIESIKESKDINKGFRFIITVEWKKSHMWGMNPRSYTNYGFKSESIGGCGYDKLSTATAQALNSYKPLLKLLYLKEEERLKQNEFSISKLKVKSENNINKVKKERREYIGYGSGYGILPYFEGGVGVDSHINIIRNLGLKMDRITSTSNTDVFLITKED